jgi:hypothetical protein
MLWNPWIVLIHRYHSSCCDYGTEKRMGTHEWLNHSSTKTGQAQVLLKKIRECMDELLANVGMERDPLVLEEVAREHQ